MSIIDPSIKKSLVDLYTSKTLNDFKSLYIYENHVETIGQEFKNKYKIDEIDEIFYPNIISLISLIKKYTQLKNIIKGNNSIILDIYFLNSIVYISLKENKEVYNLKQSEIKKIIKVINKVYNIYPDIIHYNFYFKALFKK